MSMNQIQGATGPSSPASNDGGLLFSQKQQLQSAVVPFVAPKPTALRPDFTKIPDGLKALDNWVMWRFLPPTGGQKYRKVPFQINGKAASSTDRTTWSSFEICKAAYERGGYDGAGFVFDGAIGEDGLCFVGIDFDNCIDANHVLQEPARSHIKSLGTYAEQSVSGTGVHCIARAKPLNAITYKSPDSTGSVEIYCDKRYFTFTGHTLTFEKIKSVPEAINTLHEEVLAKAGQTAKPLNAFNVINMAGFTGGPAPEFAGLGLDESLSDGIKSDSWVEALSDKQKDEVVDHALSVIASNTKLLEIGADGGDNYQYFRLTTAVAVSGAPHAEDYFVLHALGAKNADPEDSLRQHFERCQADADGRITIRTLLKLAEDVGADFSRWQRPTPTAMINQAPANNPVLEQLLPVSEANFIASFSNIPHRQWLYGVDLIRGEITVAASPGGAGKTSLALGMAVSIATGRALLGERIWGGTDLKSLYINAEDSGVEMRRRTWAFCLQHGITEQELDRLYIAGTDDARVKALSFLRTIDKSSLVLDAAGLKRLEELVISLRPDLVVIDPLVVLCGGGNINDNAAMSLVILELKRLAIKLDCAILIIHHTRKGGEPGSAEAVSGASAIVNLARRAIMPVTMTEEEAVKLKVWPSQRYAYFKVVDAKSNLAPRSDDTPWYRLNNITLPNAEPPTYEHGDGVQAVERVQLPLLNSDIAAADEQIIRRAILDTVEKGKMIDGQVYPYSPNVTGATNERTLLNDAMAAVKTAIGRPWHEGDLKAAVNGTIKSLVSKKWLVEAEKIKGPRFRRGSTLRVDWPRAGLSKELSSTAASHEEDGPDKESSGSSRPSEASSTGRVSSPARSPNCGSASED